jgi:WD40 repeat protein
MPRRLFLWAYLLMVAANSQAQEPTTLKQPGGWVGAIAFSPNNRDLAVGTSDGQVSLWDVTLGKKILSLQKHRDAVAALSWSAKGGLLASGSHDGAVMMRDFANKKLGGFEFALQRNKGAVMAVALSPDGRKIYTGGIDATINELVFKDLGLEQKSFFHHTSWVNGLALDPSGALLASASSDNSLQVHRVADRNSINIFRVTEGEIRSVAFSPDGKWVAAGIRYGNVRVWDLEMSKEIASFKPFAGETWAVAFTPDGKTLVAGGGDWHKPSDVRRWDVGSWKELAPLPHSGEVLCLAISSDGHWLAAGSWDRTVRIWKLAK